MAGCVNGAVNTPVAPKGLFLTSLISPNAVLEWLFSLRLPPVSGVHRHTGTCTCSGRRRYPAGCNRNGLSEH